MDSLIAKVTEYFIGQGISGVFNVIAMYVIYRLSVLVVSLMEKRLEESKALMQALNNYTTALNSLTDVLKMKDRNQ